MEEYTRSRFALDLDACSENILTFREIPYVSSYAKKKNEMSLAMAIAWKEVLLSSCLSKSIHFSHSRVNVRYNFLSFYAERYRANKISKEDFAYKSRSRFCERSFEETRQGRTTYRTILDWPFDSSDVSRGKEVRKWV